MTTAEMALLPGQHLDAASMPGHWVLARLGKTVLRPGGLGLTRALLDHLAIGCADTVVEFAPGLGVTARQTLAHRPAAYTAVERDPAAATRVRSYLVGEQQQVVVGTAQDTGLPPSAASVVYGEALLTMQSAAGKAAIVAEAARLLLPGGRYGLHEIAVADTASAAQRASLEADLLGAIKVGARPLSRSEWVSLLATQGLRVVHHQVAPMALLEPRRLLADEGLRGVLRFGFNLLAQPVCRRRVLQMRQVFRKHRHLMTAILLVATKAA
ncbi:MAG: methyltransferase domain-containing protein [Fimbriimonadaceae bacterium]|nr:methyltransferase domain-containing protein [Fimbriimonadaceae bacterium]